MMKHTLVRWSLPLVVVLALAACGGGGGGNGGYFPIAIAPPATTPPTGGTTPPVVLSPYDTFVAYMKAIIQTALDTSEPADVAAFDPPPVSDVLEPVATQ